jgi:hypothetical protein
MAELLYAGQDGAGVYVPAHLPPAGIARQLLRPFPARNCAGDCWTKLLCRRWLRYSSRLSTLWASASKVVLRETLSSHARVEGLDRRVVGRFPRPAEFERDSVHLRPLIERARGELRPVVALDRGWQPACVKAQGSVQHGLPALSCPQRRAPARGFRTSSRLNRPNPSSASREWRRVSRLTQPIVFGLRSRPRPWGIVPTRTRFQCSLKGLGSACPQRE